MDDTQLHAIAVKSVKGVFALVSRSFLIQIFGIVTSLLLTIFLDPGSFGVFFVVSSIIVFFNYFQDIGLAAGLIQKKEEPTKSDLRTVFTIQQALVLLLIIPAVFFSGRISQFYNLNDDGHILLIALLVSFFLTSMRTIPTVLLERKLDYGKLVIPQILENVVYNACLIVFAVMGFGVKSFTIAVLARSIVGLVATYAIQGWPIGIAFNSTSFKKLISFGIPFQTNSILALIKDDFLTIYLGKILPLSQVGYIGFAQRLSFLPLRLVMDNIIKITFPSFSRLQHDPHALKIGIEKSLFIISSAIFPVTVGIIAFSPFLVEFIPKYQKWEPALISVTFFSLSTVLSSISTPLTNFLNAIGKVKITLYFMVFWTAAIWLLTPLLVFRIGYHGVALSSFLVSLSSVFVFVIARRYVSFSVIRPIHKQFVSACAMFVLALVLKGFVNNFLMMVIVGIITLVFYIMCMMLLARNDIIKTVKFVTSSIKEKE